MIIVDDPSVLQDDFVKLLEGTKIYALEEITALGEKTMRFNGDDFETLVYNNSLKASKNTPFDGHVIQTGPHAFPDIIARKYFGIEVKMTTGDKWSSTGNSILETTRIDDVERIYMFFGKFGGTIDIKYRSYQECLYDIGVTHSPRYKIGMDLNSGDSIFEKMGISYDVLRKGKDPIGKIKNYYRKQLKTGEELWWIDTQTDEKTVSPIIRPFRMLSKNEQKKIVIEAIIFFPEIFGKSATKYERPAAYLITKYNCVSSSLRDIFTAGGKVDITINGKSVIVPQIFSLLMNNARDIQSLINEIDEEDLKYYWRADQIITPRLAQWKQMLDFNTGQQLENLVASDIYEWGLK